MVENYVIKTKYTIPFYHFRLEIGTSLSHFVIAEATVIFLQLFYLLAKYLMQLKCLIGRRGTTTAAPASTTTASR